MKSRSSRSAGVAGGLLLLSLPLVAQPTEASLITAWERLQRSDRETITFERQGDGSYRFATKRFPFDGQLKLLKATVDDRTGSDQYVRGILEVELAGLPEKVRQDYGQSYALWTAGNTLMYDVATKRWLTARELQEVARARLPSSAFWGGLWSWGPAILFILILVFILRMLGRAQRKQKEYMGKIDRSFELSERSFALPEKNVAIAEQSLRLVEDSNRVLKEILGVLQKTEPR